MYLPAHFAESRVEVLQALMREQPFASLVSLGEDGLTANHFPLHLVAAAGPLGTLQGHVARANPLWKQSADTDVLVIFHGPQAYVTPSWYETKRQHGKAVPTWNYVVVQARGRLRVIDDAGWLRRHLEILVDSHEASLAEPCEPWKIGDAPPEYIEQMLKAVVGIEIEITGLTGKWKTSQNQPPANRVGVVAGLQQQGSTDALQMAALVTLVDAKLPS